MEKKEKIEILGLGLFQTLAEEMEIVEKVQGLLANQDVGWHYFLDFAWILREIRGLPRGSLILDAGAGAGLAQFLLLELGYNVISVDLCERKLMKVQADRYGEIAMHLHDKDRIFSHPYLKGRQEDNKGALQSITESISEILKKTLLKKRNRNRTMSKIQENKYKPKEAKIDFENLLKSIESRDVSEHCGRLFMYQADIRDMYLLPDNYVDAVISISAIEHNSPEDVKKCVKELLRVTKPGGTVTITVSASQSEDWFHEPSRGWCYSEKTLKKLFQLPGDVQSNYSQREELFEDLKEEDNELHKRLGSHYYKSGDNGMPWGKWDPKYQPVGVVKIK